MSSPAALATVTATLHHLLSNVAPGATVTTQPPSIARNGGGGDQINIVLYSTHYNAAFRNSPIPGQARNGERAPPSDETKRSRQIGDQDTPGRMAAMRPDRPQRYVAWRSSNQNAFEES